MFVVLAGYANGGPDYDVLYSALDDLDGVLDDQTLKVHRSSVQLSCALWCSTCDTASHAATTAQIMHSFANQALQ